MAWMSADDPTERKQQQSEADRTLLGVAPPKLESLPDSRLRSPVFVRSGTAGGAPGDEPLPLPRMALPSRPLAPLPLEMAGPSAALPSAAAPGSGLGQLLRAQPLLWMVALPSAVAALMVGIAVLTAPLPKAKPVVESAGPARAVPAAPREAEKPAERTSAEALAALEGKAPETLTARELVQIAEGRAAREREAAKAFREQLVANAELLKEKSTQAKLLTLAGQGETSREALLALSAIDGPLGPDLLYEAWTGTSARTDATELARALLYSSDVRPRASNALSVALDLRAADTCEKNRDVLPRALTDGDKRSLHLLVKLLHKRGCGPKKLDDCFACLRANKDELMATVNAVKARRAPSYPAR